ncbi:MAG: T9SS type A sorting domain-containing protein [Candidatus Cloacimonetes bacterium]|nr:T9SS type A sorting domain-containing protein [Candidatus Cloacimonadota bacterium]
MKKLILIILTLSFVFGLAFAKEMQPTEHRKPINIDARASMVRETLRNAPAYTFTKTPTALMTSYYDYMIGSYNGIPIRVIPDPEYPGYFLTYHGRRTATGTRRAFYAHLDANGNVLNNNEITAVDNNEGYPTMAVDPVSGKPMYAWHANADDDEPLEVEFASDAFMFGISGLFNEIQVIADNPYTVVAPDGQSSDNNKFIWPTAEIGPSPIAGMSRVYVIMRNSETHTYGPSENPLIAYADFDGDMLEGGVPLEWNLTNIPEMDQWNHDDTWRRPFHSLTVDNMGNVYYAGYHFATESDGSTDIPEEDVDIFMCDNYGEGTWSRVSGWSDLASWNPPDVPGGSGFTFGDGDEYATGQAWRLSNSSHLNAVTDNRGRVIFPGIWAYSHESGVYWPAFQVVKSMIWNPSTNSFKVSEIFPRKSDEDDFNTAWTPWDTEAPFGEAEYILSGGTYYLDYPDLYYPFPHWDASLHSDAMYFHYNNIKVSEVNEQGMMVAVWQDSYNAKNYNEYNDDDFLDYAQTPEIWISVSSNQGDNWSDPIILNNVVTTEFAGIKPMWVYPADKVLYVGEDNGQKVGKIGVMFYNDFTWGSNAIDPPAHQNADGGEVMFMELQITFPIPGDDPGANDDHTVPAVSRMLSPNYPNPFNPETTISFDMPKAGNARVDVFNVKGQLVKTLFDGAALYGKNTLVWNGTDNNGNNVPSGVYFYRLNANGTSESRKMMLMK